MATLDELRATIRDVAKEVEHAGHLAPATFPNGNDHRHLMNQVNRFKKLGVKPNIHDGKGDQMKGDSNEAKQMTMEWFAGQLMEIIRKKQWFAVNSWLNCVEKFTA